MSAGLPGPQAGPQPAAPIVLRHLPWLIAGWVLFIWLWWLVVQQPWQVLGLQRLVLWAAALFPAVTLVWIAHNRNIHRRLGPRRGLRVVPVQYPTDFNGRSIDADWPALLQAREVTIDIDAGGHRKVYSVVPAAAASEGAH